MRRVAQEVSKMKRMFAAITILVALAVIPVSAQQFPPQGDDLTSSLGSFKIQVTPQFSALFAGCPAYANPILSSPTLYDPATRVGRSSAILDAGAPDINGVAVGTAGTIVKESQLFPPPGFPCSGVNGCLSGSGTREIHTEVRSLRMVNLAGALPVVRAGLWYDKQTVQGPPSRVSPGEVESHSGPGGPPAKDLPGSSFFNIFVRVDMPACGNFPGGTLQNQQPLVVKNFNLTALPPKVVYLHDTSSVVPILFLNANPPLWNAGDILGYFALAGHGVGYTNAPADVNAFNTFMSTQPVTCVTVATAAAATPGAPAAPATAATSGGTPAPAVVGVGTCTPN
jgi:hypothetical protein